MRNFLPLRSYLRASVTTADISFSFCVRRWQVNHQYGAARERLINLPTLSRASFLAFSDVDETAAVRVLVAVLRQELAIVYMLRDELSEECRHAICAEDMSHCLRSVPQRPTLHVQKYRSRPQMWQLKHALQPLEVVGSVRRYYKTAFRQHRSLPSYQPSSKGTTHTAYRRL